MRLLSGVGSINRTSNLVNSMTRVGSKGEKFRLLQLQSVFVQVINEMRKYKPKLYKVIFTKLMITFFHSHIILMVLLKTVIYLEHSTTFCFVCCCVFELSYSARKHAGEFELKARNTGPSVTILCIIKKKKNSGNTEAKTVKFYSLT